MYKVINAKNATLTASVNVFISIARNDGKKGKSGMVMEIPELTENSVMSILNNKHGMAWVINEINSLRSKIASKATQGIDSVIKPEVVGITNVLSVMQKEIESTRISKESIATWFDSELSSVITTKITANNPTMAPDKIAKLVENYKEYFVSLAGRNISMSDAIKNQLIKALDLLGEEYNHPIAEKIALILDEVKESTADLAAL